MVVSGPQVVLKAKWLSWRWLYAIHTRIPCAIFIVVNLLRIYVFGEDVHYFMPKSVSHEFTSTSMLGMIPTAALIAMSWTVLNIPYIDRRQLGIFATLFFFGAGAVLECLRPVWSPHSDGTNHSKFEFGPAEFASMDQHFLVLLVTLGIGMFRRRKGDINAVAGLVTIGSFLAVFFLMQFSPAAASKIQMGSDSGEGACSSLQFIVIMFVAWFLERWPPVVGAAPTYALLSALYRIATMRFLSKSLQCGLGFIDAVTSAHSPAPTASGVLALGGSSSVWLAGTVFFAHMWLQRTKQGFQSFSLILFGPTLVAASALFESVLIFLPACYSPLLTSADFSTLHRAVLGTLIALATLAAAKQVRPRPMPIHCPPRPGIQDLVSWSVGNRFLMDFGECKAQIVRMLSASTVSKSVEYSTFLCDFNFPLDSKGNTMCSLLNALAARGVAVRILYNPMQEYGNQSVEEVRLMLHSSIRIKAVRSNLLPSLLSARIQAANAYGYHHQKYICVDGTEAMVCGCDVNGERSSWLELNSMGYYWDEIAVVMPCTPAMAAWFRTNFETVHTVPAPYPLVSTSMEEHDAIVHLIRTSKREVYFANQSFLCAADIYQNLIGQAIVDRIVVAEARGEPFQCMLLTNAGQKDEPSVFTKLYCSYAPMLSQLAMEEYAMANGLSVAQLYDHLLIATLGWGGVTMKVHSNIIISDQDLAIRSSSNLNDRCLSPLPTDSELGVLMRGETVAAYCQAHYRRLLAGVRTEEVVDRRVIPLAEICQSARADVVRRRKGQQSCSMVVPMLSPIADVSFQTREQARHLLRVMTGLSEGAVGGLEAPEWNTASH